MINVETGQELSTAELGSASRHGPAFSRMARRSSPGWGNVLRFFDAQTGTERFVSEGAHSGGVSAVRYTPDRNTLVTAGDDGTIRSGTSGSAEELAVITDHGSSHRLAISPRRREGRRGGDPGPVAGRSRLGPQNRPASAGMPARNRRSTRPRPWRSRPTGTSFSSTVTNMVSRTIDIATGQRTIRRTTAVPAGQEKMHQSDLLPIARSLRRIGTSQPAPARRPTSWSWQAESERFSCPGYMMSFTPDGHGLAVATAGDRERRPAGSRKQRRGRAGGDRLRRQEKILVPTDRVSWPGVFAGWKSPGRRSSDGNRSTIRL